MPADGKKIVFPNHKANLRCQPWNESDYCVGVHSPGDCPLEALGYFLGPLGQHRDVGQFTRCLPQEHSLSLVRFHQRYLESWLEDGNGNTGKASAAINVRDGCCIHGKVCAEE